MTVQEYRDYIAAGNPVVAGSEAHLFMHQMSQEAIRITMEINNKYHTPEELRGLFSELWDIEVPETFGMFPPFNTDCGKNTHIGERVFINSGCKFQDQGGIFIGNDCLLGLMIITRMIAIAIYCSSCRNDILFTIINLSALPIFQPWKG